MMGLFASSALRQRKLATSAPSSAGRALGNAEHLVHGAGLDDRGLVPANHNKQLSHRIRNRTPRSDQQETGAQEARGGTESSRVIADPHVEERVQRGGQQLLAASTLVEHGDERRDGAEHREHLLAKASSLAFLHDRGRLDTPRDAAGNVSFSILKGSDHDLQLLQRRCLPDGRVRLALVVPHSDGSALSSSASRSDRGLGCDCARGWGDRKDVRPRQSTAATAAAAREDLKKLPLRMVAAGEDRQLEPETACRVGVHAPDYHRLVLLPLQALSSLTAYASHIGRRRREGTLGVKKGDALR
ncbi:hypothetical protein ZWY2020_038676 [Hordeum vulgare]|nr:hypothetical protein ZWY2020_038676 [Hordeum vulgare]